MNNIVIRLAVLLSCSVSLFVYAQKAHGFYGDQTNQCIMVPNNITNDGAHPETVTLWEEHQHETGVYGDTWIGPYVQDSRHRSGSRDTIIFVPSQFNYSEPPDVIFWLHGHWGFNKFATRLLRHIPELQARGKNPIVIAVEQPWSAWTSTPTSRNGTGPFRQPGEFEQWLDLIFPKLYDMGIPPENIMSSKVTLYGHSAGGSGILSMARSGALNILQPGTIVFSDSTYGSWFDGFYRSYYRDNPGSTVIVLAKENTSTSSSMSRFFSHNPTAASIPSLWYVLLNSRQWTHKRIGDNCLLYPGRPFSP